MATKMRKDCCSDWMLEEWKEKLGGFWFESDIPIGHFFFNSYLCY
jgi:hypothetical protein